MENPELIRYTEFLFLLQNKLITFDYFQKYTYDELLKIKQIYEIGTYLQHKANKDYVND